MIILRLITQFCIKRDRQCSSSSNKSKMAFLEQQLFTIWFIFLTLFISIYCNPLTDSSPRSESASIHAILVAGTSEWTNYRHQANIAHGYQVLVNHGVNRENIIVMMVNDVVNHEKNPFKGQLFNSPGGPDVYLDLKVDYSGDEVSAANFLNILKGVSTKPTQKVLNSGPDDTVLIYISSFGANGLIGFPRDVLTSASLNQALVGMHNHTKYGQMMIILDTDHSASIFDSILPANINIYSLTSTSTDQPNYACFCNEPEFPYTCIGTSHSVAWLTGAGSKESLMDETLDQQFDSIIQALSEALPQTPIDPKKFGTKVFGDLRVGRFMGQEKSVSPENSTVIEHQLTNFEVPYEMARLESLETHDDDPFNEIKNARHSIDRAFYRLSSDMCGATYCTDAESIVKNNQSVQIVDHQLFSQMVTKFHSDCLNLGENPYLLQKMYVFANVLSESHAKIAADFSKFGSHLYQACRRRIIGHGYHHVV